MMFKWENIIWEMIWKWVLTRRQMTLTCKKDPSSILDKPYCHYLCWNGMSGHTVKWIDIITHVKYGDSQHNKNELNVEKSSTK